MRLREVRLEKNMTQAMVAKALGCSDVVYNRYETDTRQPSLETLIALSKLFSVSTDYLLEVDDIPNKHISGNILTEFEEDTLTAFRQLTKENKYIITGKINELLKDQRSESLSLLKEAK